MISRYETEAMRLLLGPRATRARLEAVLARAPGADARAARDTVSALQARDALVALRAGVERLRTVIDEQAAAHARTPQARRVHGRITGATTLGETFRAWSLALGRDLDRLAAAHDQVAFGALRAGADGPTAKEEAGALAAFDLTPEPVPGRGVARDRFAEVGAALALLGGNLEQMAVEVRHLQRTDVAEAREPFGKGQTGSSAMPHKKNPITGERLTGMARLLRASAQALLQSQAPWHHGDDAHVPVDRVALVDAFHLADYMLAKAQHVLAGLVVSGEEMAGHLEAASVEAETSGSSAP